jgi:Tat protein translocase TatC
MPIGSARMPLLDHLGELRRRLTIVVLSLAVTAVVLYNATPTIIDVLMDPIRSVLPDGSSLTVLTLLGGFTIRFKVACFVAIIVCTPIIIWEVMAFFLPALKESERRWVIPTVAALVALFFIGMLFCYFVALRTAFGWMIDQTTGFATATVNAEDYLNIEMLLEIGFGIAFEIPLVIFYLSIAAHRALRVVPRPVALHLRRAPHALGHRHARRQPRHDAAHVRSAPRASTRSLSPSPARSSSCATARKPSSGHATTMTASSTRLATEGPPEARESPDGTRKPKEMP